MVRAPILARSSMFEYYMNSLGLQCNIQLHDLPVAFVLNIIGTMPGWAEVIPGSSGVNAGWLGRCSNVFNNYASVLELQCNTVNFFYCHSHFKHHEKCFGVDWTHYQGSGCQ